ncbi:unnamed protein product [Pedinophyceae sp. YPF-701]|nr:unnamed protein product [Pedinophyceae sp. YPF-701]
MKLGGKASVLPLLIVAYSLVASTLLVMNKVALSSFPHPSTLLFLQLAIAAAGVKLGDLLGLVEADPLTADKAWASSAVVLAFYGVVISNFKALSYVNVDTVIVVRTCMPFVVAVGEFAFMNRNLPSVRTWISMALVCGTTSWVMLRDTQVPTLGLVWLSIWFGTAVFDMLYLKHFTTAVKLSTFGRVYYTNTLSCIPALIIMVVHGELTPSVFVTLFTTPRALLAAFVTGLLGLAMSILSWALRSAVSALSFTVIGVMNKVLSVMINGVIWDKHGSTMGMLLTVGGILAGALYEQPAPRERGQRLPINKNLALVLMVGMIATIVFAISRLGALLEHPTPFTHP